MSSSAVRIPTDVQRLITTLDISDCTTELATHMAPLFIDSHMAYVLRHPTNPRIVFRSDRRYFLDDESGGTPINPFSISSFGNSSIVDSEGKLVATAQEYWRAIGWMEETHELSDRMSNTLAAVVQETINGFQAWNKTMNYDYLVNQADDIMLSRLAGCESEFVAAMNEAGYQVDTRGLYQENILTGGREGSNIYKYGEITADMLVKRLHAIRRNNADWDTVGTPTIPTNDDAQMARLLAGKQRKLSITNEDEEKDKLASQLDAESEGIDTSDIKGSQRVGDMNRESYNHHVSNYGDSSSKILNAYVMNMELKYALEEIAHKCQRVIRKFFPIIQALCERSEDVAFGWDVYACRPGGKNKIEVHHVHDLRLYEWELIRKNGYDAVANQLVGTKIR